jgi:hypothetical protein
MAFLEWIRVACPDTGLLLCSDGHDVVAPGVSLVTETIGR